MKMEIDVPEIQQNLMKFSWERGFLLRSKMLSDGAVLIEGNREGLISLARHLLSLAGSTVPAGFDFHLDESNSLDDGSVQLIFART